MIDALTEVELNKLEAWVRISLDRGFPTVRSSMLRAIVELRLRREKAREEEGTNLRGVKRGPPNQRNES